MSKLADWIRCHQVAAFYLIAFAITWGLGFSYSGLLKRNQYLLLPLVVIMACGPALAGITVSAIINIRPKQGTRRAFWIAFAIALLASAIVWLVDGVFYEHVPFSPSLAGLILVSVVPVAFVISAAYSRIPAVRSCLSSLLRLRGVWGWALLGLAGTTAVVVLSIPIGSLLNGKPISTNRFPEASLVLLGLVPVKFFKQLFFFNATGEEVGWRGFVLPRLQARTSPLIAALVIGVFWTVWHFFGWQAEGKAVLTLNYWAMMFPGHMLFSVLTVWIYNRAGGSILVAGVTHAALNTAQAFIPNDIWGMIVVMLVIALVLIRVDRMWKKLPPDHPAVGKGPQVATP
jgi:membrane protease YdiL (CAAX protease family)